MSALQSHYQAIKQQVDTTPWLKWALIVICLLAAVSILLELDDIRVKRQKSAIDVELRLRQITALKGQTIWLQREAESAKIRDSLIAQLPEVETSGMAQAATQSWLRSLSATFESQQDISLRIQSALPLDEAPGIIKVNAAINGSISPRQAVNFLRQIENSPNLAVVETVSLQSTEHSMMSLTLNAYYRIKNESGR